MYVKRLKILVRKEGKRVKSADGLTGEVYTHLKIVFGENPKTILPE